MQRPAWPFYFLILLMGISESVGSAQRFKSPRGKFEYSFDLIARDIPVDPDRPTPLSGTRAVHYTAGFYRPGSISAIALTSFYDFQTAPSQPFPTPLEKLAEGLLWSPEEDFVVLPKENWPPEKKKDVHRRIVSLDKDSSWQTVDFMLDDAPLAWQDRYTVVGNYREHCTVAVGQFDARSGRSSMIAQAANPAGYSMTSASDKFIHYKKILGPCANPSDASTFVPECGVFNLSFQRREIGPCQP